MSCLAGIDEPDGGTVRIAGERMSHRSEPTRAKLRARFVGLLFQSANLIPHLTVRGNVRLAQRLAPDTTSRDIPQLLQTLGIDTRADALAGQLSRGESARAGLAVALANSPAVLLADEPTGELDAATESQVLRLLSGLAASGVAVVVGKSQPRSRRSRRSGHHDDRRGAGMTRPGSFRSAATVPPTVRRDK